MTKIQKRNFICLTSIFISLLIISSSLEFSINPVSLADKTYSSSPTILNIIQKWTPIEVVSTESTISSYKPVITTDKESNVYTVWEDQTDYLGAGIDYDLFFKKRDFSTSTWTTTEYISTEGVTEGGSFRPDLAVDSAGNVHVTWEGVDLGGTLADRQIYYKRWNASTTTWTTTELVSTGSTQYSGPPDIAIDPQDNIHIVWDDETDILSSGADSDIFYRSLNTTDYTWNDMVLISTNSTSNSFDPRVATDSFGNIHVAWDDWTNILGANADRDIFYQRWDKNLGIWTPTELVTILSDAQSSLGDITTDTAGKVHIVWGDQYTFDSNDGSDNDIFYKSKDTFAWSNLELVSTEINGESYSPSIAVDSFGNINIVWRDLTNYANSGTDQDIFFKRWDATFSAWMPILAISDESNDLSKMADIAADSFGNIHIVWEDVTDLYDSGGDYDVFYRMYAFPPIAPTLASIVPNPTDLSSVSLVWNEIKGVSSYHVYRSDSFIWSIEGVTPLTTVTTTSYVDSLPAVGIFYYVIVATNYAGDSPISNCQYIEYEIPSLQEYFIFTVLIMSTLVISIVIYSIRKKKTNEK